MLIVTERKYAFQKLKVTLSRVILAGDPTKSGWSERLLKSRKATDPSGLDF